MLVILTAVLAFLASIWYLFLKEPDWAKNFHGNTGWPIIGSVFELHPYLPHLTYQSWAQKYGSVMKVRQFGEYLLILSSYDAIYEVMVTKSNDYAGRPQAFREKLSSRNFKNLVNHDFSQKFTRFKKLLMKGMRTGLGGVMNLEDAVNEHTEELVSSLREAQSKPVDIRDNLRYTILNIILTLAFGMRLSRDDPRVSEINRMERLSVHATGVDWTGVVLDCFPWVRMFGSKRYEELQEDVRIKNEVCNKFTDHAKKSKLSGRTNNCIIDPVLDEGEKPDSEIDAYNIYAASSDLVVAGLTTTSSLIYLLINLFIHYPGVQKKAQEEIDNTAPGPTVTLEDRARMPYLQATIFEALRYFSHLPMGLAHKTTCHTTIQGKPIPPGVTVWTNLWALHHDEMFWKDPHTFDPERFLEDGILIGPEHPNRKRLLVFGAGRRVCLGENMALLRIFLIVSNLLKQFNFEPPDGVPLVTCDPRNEQFGVGIILHPPAYLVKPIPRATKI